MPHDHSHHSPSDQNHQGRTRDAGGDGRLWLAVSVNLALTVAQIVGGVISGSLALVADAIHNLSDAISLVIAFGARRIARRPSDQTMTYGYARAETVAALVNYTTLIAIGVWLVSEAVTRFFEPEPIDGWTVVVLAAIALVVDAVTALLTFALSKQSINIRAAFLHNVADALGSVGVIVAGTLVIVLGWTVVDPIVTLLIAAYVLWHAGAEIGTVIRILMQGAPPGLASADVLRAMQDQDGVEAVHHLHLWQMDEREPAVEAHVVVADDRWADARAILSALKARLAALGIEHSTLELELARDGCDEAPPIGHDGA